MQGVTQLTNSDGTETVLGNHEDSLKVLFTTYDSPKCIQSMSYVFFLFLIFHVEHEAHFDKFELEKSLPISKVVLTKPGNLGLSLSCGSSLSALSAGCCSTISHT